MQKVVLVTGASSGIGRRIAGRLASAGCRVYGTSRNPAQPVLDGFELISLDVTSDASAAACAAEVTARAGRIDVLVNNAGVELLGALEEMSIAEAKTIFETNFFGVMRMTSVVLPAMRAQRSGLIVNIGSLAGVVASPFHGMYAATKHALAGYTEALWYELEAFNIRVALIEPGFFKSEIGQRKAVPAQSIEDYAAAKSIVIAAWDHAIETGADPAPVAEKVLQVVEGRARGLRQRVGKDSLLARFKPLSPDWLVRAFIRRRFNLHRSNR